MLNRDSGIFASVVASSLTEKSAVTGRDQEEDSCAIEGYILRLEKLVKHPTLSPVDGHASDISGNVFANHLLASVVIGAGSEVLLLSLIQHGDIAVQTSPSM